ncbi:MAG: hypothetical protein V4628_13640 [Pseudomonadota bacterium]
MKDPAQSIQREITKSRTRVLELETKLTELPSDAGPEIVSMYEKLLAKELKYQDRLTVALAPPPSPKKAPVIRIAVAAVLVLYLIYRFAFAA